MDNGTASAIVWKSNFAPLLTPSTRRLLDGVAAWVLHRSIRWTWPHRRRKCTPTHWLISTQVRGRAVPAPDRSVVRQLRGHVRDCVEIKFRGASFSTPSTRRRTFSTPSTRRRTRSQLWASSQILSCFVRLVIAARRTLSVESRLGSSPWAARGVSRELVPARWRGSSTTRFSITAAPSPRNDLVKNYQVHPTHWLISTQVRDRRGAGCHEGHGLLYNHWPRQDGAHQRRRREAVG